MTYGKMTEALRAASKAEALASFLARKRHFEARLAAMQKLADDHFNVQPDAVTWADCSTVARANELLDEAAAFLNIA